MSRKVCPITGVEAEFHDHFVTSGLGNRFVHADGDEIAISESGMYALEGIQTQAGVPPLSKPEIQAAIALLRSKFWRICRSGGRSLFITTRDHVEEIQEHPEKQNPDLLKHFHIVAIEDAAAETLALSFTTKALNTLENICDSWHRTGQVPNIPYALSNQGLVFGHLDRKEDGMAYGCNEQTATMVYSWLRDEGYLKGRAEVGKQLIDLTPSALIEVEKIKAGREASMKRGFFIRRYDPDTDIFFRPILDEVMAVTGCEISAVWERQKNEKLDELILRRIRESSVIVLDVTGERFNVGLEAGFALALRKQMIVLRDKAEKDGDLPFDIRTMNCFFYDRSEPDKLQEKLTERVLDALEEAKIGAH